MPRDVLSFSSTADKAIYKNLVLDCKADEPMLPFFVDTDVFFPYGKTRRDALRKKFKISSQEVIYLYAGRVTSEKNVQGILAVFSNVLKEVKNARLLIVGNISDQKFHEFGTGPYDIESFFDQILASDKLLKKKVTFYSAVKHSDLADFYNLADVFINLTLHHDENFGFTQVEAMSCGLPIIGTDWGGLKDSIAHGKNGLLVPTYVTSWGVRIDSPVAISNVLLLAKSKALRKKMGHNGRRRALNLYSMPVFEKTLVSQIRRAIKPSSHIKK